MLAFDEGSEDSAFSEFVAKGAHLAHAQVRKEILYFEDVIE